LNNYFKPSTFWLKPIHTSITRTVANYSSYHNTAGYNRFSKKTWHTTKLSFALKYV